MIDASGRAYHSRRRVRSLCCLTALLAGLLPVAGCEPSAPRPEPGPAPGPPRIVSLGVELGALLVELGVAPGVVGADSPSLAIPELAHAVDLGAPDAPSLALARGLAPDLVLALAPPGSPAAELVAALASEGLPGAALAPGDANAVIAAIHRVGRLVGREQRAATVAARVLREVSEIATQRDGRPRWRAAWLLERDPLVVVGGSGLLHELLELAGAENAFHTPARDRLRIAEAELHASGPDVVLAPFPAPPVPAGARAVAVPPALAALPLLDVPGRVRALHRVLYPASGLPATADP